MPTKEIRLFLADDHPILRDGIKELLNTEKDIIIVGEANNGIEVLERLSDANANVLLFDILGREIKSISGQGFDAGRHTIKMEVDELPVGEYFLKVHTDFGFKTKKIIVMR